MNATTCPLQDIRNGLYTLLTASGPYHPRQISTCSFDCLEAVNTCAITFFPGQENTFEASAYDPAGTAAGLTVESYDIDGDIWIKDTGDPVAVLAKVWQAPDDLRRTLRKDTSLGGACQDFRLTRVAVAVEQEFDVGGQLWQRLKWKARAEVF